MPIECKAQQNTDADDMTCKKTSTPWLRHGPTSFTLCLYIFSSRKFWSKTSSCLKWRQYWHWIGFQGFQLFAWKTRFSFSFNLSCHFPVLIFSHVYVNQFCFVIIICFVTLFLGFELFGAKFSQRETDWMQQKMSRLQCFFMLCKLYMPCRYVY